MEQIDLTDFFQTKQGALDFKSRIATITELIYNSDFNLEKILMEQFGIEKKEKFIIMLKDNNVAVNSTAALKGFMIKIQERTAALPVFALKLAFEPREQTLKAISGWFVLNIKKQVILDITVDPKLIAGADISFNGQYFNSSKKAELDQIFKDVLIDKKNIIPETQKTNSPTSTHQSIDNLSFGR